LLDGAARANHLIFTLSDPFLFEIFINENFVINQMKSFSVFLLPSCPVNFITMPFSWGHLLIYSRAILNDVLSFFLRGVWNSALEATHSWNWMLSALEETWLDLIGSNSFFLRAILNRNRSYKSLSPNK